MTLWTVARQAPLSMGFPSRAYWSGLPFPPPEDLPSPVMEPKSSAWQVDSLPLSHLGILWTIQHLLKSIHMSLLPLLGGLNQQKCVLLQFWKLKVWNVSTVRTMFPPKPLENNHFLPLPTVSSPSCSLAYDSMEPISAPHLHMNIFSLCVFVTKFPTSFFYKISIL